MTEKPGIQIKSETATIETLCVEIKTIRINKRQMTLSVFRQIPEKDPCRYEYNSRYIYKGDYDFWGIVDYPIKDRGNYWILFAHDGIIYKFCIQNFNIESLKNKLDIGQLFIAV